MILSAQERWWNVQPALNSADIVTWRGYNITKAAVTLFADILI